MRLAYKRVSAVIGYFVQQHGHYHPFVFSLVLQEQTARVTHNKYHHLVFSLDSEQLVNVTQQYRMSDCSTLRRRIKGTARSIISILRTVGIYSTGREFIALWAETDLRSTQEKFAWTRSSATAAGRRATNQYKHRQLVQY